MLPGFECRDGDRRVEIRRRADPDDVEVGPVKHLGPIVHDLRNVKFPGDALVRFDPQITDRSDLDIG